MLTSSFKVPKFKIKFDIISQSINIEFEDKVHKQCLAKVYSFIKEKILPYHLKVCFDDNTMQLIEFKLTAFLTGLIASNVLYPDPLRENVWIYKDKNGNRYHGEED